MRKRNLMKKTGTEGLADSKPHYELLDGLRGVAALMVIWYHVFEAFATSPIDQKFNHGYLAVDFFFILSGFVIGYAYDDRWEKSLTISGFFKRRLKRLHPMVIMGTLLGAASFILQGSEKWDGTPVPLSFVMLAVLLQLFMIPAVPGTAAEIRGNGEMFPLNGPSWSLFFEYVGNILYALFLRKLPMKALAVFVGLAGAGLAFFALGNFSGAWNIGVGWSLSGYNFPGGFLRMLFSFSMGLLMSRVFRPVKIKGAFWICSATVIALLSVPYIGADSMPWLNGLYDSICAMIVFPLLVWLGASGTAEGQVSSRLCRFFGEISYPVYIIHYPIMYLFYSWVWKNGFTFGQVWPVAAGIFFGSIALAWLCLKFYDMPVRKRLGGR